ncbi:hypothetical protein [Halosimplex rubrum]|uniref:hypothetical protein n=1 Tax=Halosimplex rubrum TaxID=869889 RepID=UPI0031B61FB9
MCDGFLAEEREQTREIEDVCGNGDATGRVARLEGHALGLSGISNCRIASSKVPPVDLLLSASESLASRTTTECSERLATDRANCKPAGPPPATATSYAGTPAGEGGSV